VHVAHMGERRSANRVLMRTEGRRPLGKPRCEWEDSLNVCLQEVGSGAWTGYGQVSGSCKFGIEPLGFI